MGIVEISVDYLSKCIDCWDFSLPLIVGVSGPQGSGKSYLSEHLTCELSNNYGHLNVVNISLDDFYLTHKQQSELKSKYPGCPLITEGRGLPGTHSLEILSEVLEKVRHRAKDYTIPFYDKSRFNGEGDRAPQDQWVKVAKPIDIVILEGWLVGFKPVASDENLATIFQKARASEPDPDTKKALGEIEFAQIRTINQLLGNYVKFWDSLDRFICLSTQDLHNVYAWRLQQEANLIKLKGTGMTTAEVKAFVDRYYPVYLMYYHTMVQNGVLDEGKNLKIELQLDRSISGSKSY